MAAGKSFNLTDKRIEELKKLLGRQYSVRYVADKWGIDHTTLSTKMSELNLDPKKLKAEGINTMKAKLYDSIDEIVEPDKRARAALDFLKHYDKSDDVASAKSEVNETSTSTATIINIIEDFQ